MSNSHLEIQITQKANMIASKMIGAGVPIPVALYIAKYASSIELSGDKRDILFELMIQWEKESNVFKKNEILSDITSIIENRRNKILSS